MLLQSRAASCPNIVGICHALTWVVCVWFQQDTVAPMMLRRRLLLLLAGACVLLAVGASDSTTDPPAPESQAEDLQGIDEAVSLMLAAAECVP